MIIITIISFYKFSISLCILVVFFIHYFIDNSASSSMFVDII